MCAVYSRLSYRLQERQEGAAGAPLSWNLTLRQVACKKPRRCVDENWRGFFGSSGVMLSVPVALSVLRDFNVSKREEGIRIRVTGHYYAYLYYTTIIYYCYYYAVAAHKLRTIAPPLHSATAARAASRGHFAVVLLKAWHCFVLEYYSGRPPVLSPECLSPA